MQDPTLPLTLTILGLDDREGKRGERVINFPSTPKDDKTKTGKDEEMTSKVPGQNKPREGKKEERKTRKEENNTHKTKTTITNQDNNHKSKHNPNRIP